ncbi:MAG TPA: hypothetical protein VKB88_02430 [Bryobacteraceae bacterium]|nr:hypothetical protein [Bryobacteraceae bacterium]
MARRFVCFDQMLQVRQIDLQAIVGVDQPDAGLAEAQQRRRLANRKVPLARNVGAHPQTSGHTLARHIAGRFGRARCRHRRQIGHGAAAHQQASCLRSVAQHLLQPADRHVFQCGSRGPRPPARHVDVQRRGDHAADGRHGTAGRGDVAEKARMGIVAAELENDVIQRFQQRRKICALVRKRLLHALPQRRRSRWNQQRAVAQSRIVLDDALQRRLPHGADLVRIRKHASR